MKMRLKASALLMACVLMHCGSDGQSMRYRIKKGHFTATVSETGELDAVYSRVMTVPRIGGKYGWRFKLIGLRDHGDAVSTGDSIAQFDTQNVFKYLKEKKNELEVQKAALNKLIVEQESRVKAFQAELATAKATLDLNRIQLDKHQFASERKRKIQTLEFRKAGIQYDKTIRKAELNQKIMGNELKIQKTRIVLLENEISDSEEAIEKLKIISPLDGMMQLLKSYRTRQTIRVGDELGQGWRYASIPDLSEMEVEARINEADIGKIYMGQRVEIRLDAFPRLLFQGKISKIGKLSYKENKNDLSKVFDVLIHLEESNPVLKPGMTVRCDFVVSDVKDVFYVENECIYEENGMHYLLLGTKEKNKRRNITIGARNHQYTIIHGDIKKGERTVPVHETAAAQPSG